MLQKPAIGQVLEGGELSNTKSNDFKNSYRSLVA